MHDMRGMMLEGRVPDLPVVHANRFDEMAENVFCPRCEPFIKRKTKRFIICRCSLVAMVTSHQRRRLWELARAYVLRLAAYHWAFSQNSRDGPLGNIG